MLVFFLAILSIPSEFRYLFDRFQYLKKSKKTICLLAPSALARLFLNIFSEDSSRNKIFMSWCIWRYFCFLVLCSVPERISMHFCTITISKNEKNRIFSLEPLALARKFLTFFSRTRLKTKHSWARASEGLFVFWRCSAFRANFDAFVHDNNTRHLKMRKIPNFLLSRLWRSRGSFSPVFLGRAQKQSIREPVRMTPYKFLANLQRSE